jgi:hypothetical protein
MKWTAMIVLAGATLAAAQPATAAQLFLDMFKYSDPAFESSLQVNLTGVPGVTGVTAHAADGSPLTLSAYAPGQYVAPLGPFTLFTQAHAASIGNWSLAVEFTGGGVAAYNFTVNDFRTPFTATSFPPAPTVLSPAHDATGVAASPTFTWDNGGTHTGSLESLFVSVWSQAVPGVGIFENSFGGSLGLNDTAWTPSIVLPAGLASFLVQYETNANEDANVADPVFNAAASTVADPGLGWTSSGDLFSSDLINFTVAPEPATLALLALGGLALLRRRSR